MTTKTSTVSVDEGEIEQTVQSPKLHVGYEPELNLIVNTRYLSTRDVPLPEHSSDEAISIEGKLSVSF